MEFNKLIPSEELSSSDYHGTVNTFSSSQLKSMIEDPEIFYNKYIAKTVPKQEGIAAFDVGTYFHTSILEPEKLADEAIVYPGPVRRGGEWDKFCEANKGKVILTKKEKEDAEKLVAAVKDSPISMNYINTSKPEVSAFVEVYVMGKDIFSFNKDGNCFWLSPSGWAAGTLDFEEDDIKEFGVRLVLKVRADALGQGTGVISDLKSTTGNAKNPHEMQTKVSAYQYDLSAALYLDIFSMASGEDYHSFVWIFASKDKGNCRSYRATDRNIMVGRAKWKKAVTEIAKYIQNGWQFTDELGELGPPAYALDWLVDE